MSAFLHSFHGRLALLFFALVTLLGVVMVFACLEMARRFQDETDQQLNAPLALRMAEEFQPYLHERIDDAMIEDRIRYLTGINPRIDIYLLGSDGMIKAGYGANAAGVEPLVVDVAPLQAFVDGAAPPLWADDPMHPGRHKPFVAAPLVIMGESGCFLYVVLGSGRYDTIAGMVRGSYLARATAGGLGLFVLATALVGTALSALLTRRLRGMARVVHAFAAGRLDRRAPVDGRDEIAALAGAFNGMADTIVAGMDDLRRTDRLRRELVANVSHDLRSPLASIQGYLETALLRLEQGTADATAEVQSYLETALRNTRTLARLVAELFELSKLDARQVEPHPEPFSLEDLIQDVVMPFAPRAEAAGVHLQVDLPEGMPLVQADIGLVERAITNLLDNAIRFTPPGGEVRVVPRRGAGRVHVDVVDTGVGIPAEELPLVFERFYRVEKSRGAGGSGLGLAIARRIVELHGSTLAVQSVVGQGTTFSFSLPTTTAGLQLA